VRFRVEGCSAQATTLLAASIASKVLGPAVQDARHGLSTHHPGQHPPRPAHTPRTHRREAQDALLVIVTQQRQVVLQVEQLVAGALHVEHSQQPIEQRVVARDTHDVRRVDHLDDLRAWWGRAGARRVGAPGRACVGVTGACAAAAAAAEYTHTRTRAHTRAPSPAPPPPPHTHDTRCCTTRASRYRLAESAPLTR
jgi:hypothetical protein